MDLISVFYKFEDIKTLISKPFVKFFDQKISMNRDSFAILSSTGKIGSVIETASKFKYIKRKIFLKIINLLDEEFANTLTPKLNDIINIYYPLYIPVISSKHLYTSLKIVKQPKIGG